MIMDMGKKKEKGIAGVKKKLGKLVRTVNRATRKAWYLKSE